MRRLNEAQKPEDIVAPLVQYSVPPGGILLDLFAGNETMLAVARKTGRRAIGIEKRRSQCKLIVERLRQRAHMGTPDGLTRRYSFQPQKDALDSTLAATSADVATRERSVHKPRHSSAFQRADRAHQQPPLIARWRDHCTGFTTASGIRREFWPRQGQPVHTHGASDSRSHGTRPRDRR